MSVVVEFFGIPRQRAGVAAAEVEGDSLGDVLTALVARFPQLAADCIERGRLCDGFVANLDGQQFITAPDTPLADGNSVMLMSLDAGG